MKTIDCPVGDVTDKEREAGATPVRKQEAVAGSADSIRLAAREVEDDWEVTDWRDIDEEDDKDE